MKKIIGQGAFEPEPARDEELGALLRDGIGAVPTSDVDWHTMAARINARIAAHVTSPWWSYAARWERRMVPLALAAGIAAAFALLRIDEVPPQSTTSVSASSVSTSIVSGTTFEDAALQFAHSVTSAGDITAGIPE